MADSLHIHDLHNINKNDKFFKDVLGTINEEQSTSLIDAVNLVDDNYISIKNAVETKGEDLTGIKPSGYAAKILDIETGIDTSDATAIAEEIIVGETAYVNGVKITGTMPNNGVQNITPTTIDQSIYAGYHGGSGVVAGDADLLTENIKSGVTIFGVPGKTEVVDTTDSNATSSDIKSAKTAYVSGVKVNGILELNEWVRPEDWLSFPSISSGEQVVYGLFRVDELCGNYVSFVCRSAFTVDWGDGYIENFADNVKASHNYDFNDLSSDTATSDGFRQAIIKITPQIGNNLMSIVLAGTSCIHPVLVDAGYYSYGWLDIVINTPSATTIRVGNTVNRQTTSLKMCKILQHAVVLFTNIFYGCNSLVKAILENTENVVSLNSAFYSCYSLQVFPFMDTGNVQDISYMCYGCLSMYRFPLINTQNVTNMSYTWQLCYSLKTLPLLNTQNVTNMNLMIANCQGITDIPAFNTANVQSMTTMLQYCSSLSLIPALDLSRITSAVGMRLLTATTGLQADTNGIKRILAYGGRYAINISRCMLSEEALNEFFTNLGTADGVQTITITNNPGAATCNRTIATNKGWTLVG